VPSAHRRWDVPVALRGNHPRILGAVDLLALPAIWNLLELAAEVRAYPFPSRALRHKRMPIGT
jgi:hypothetical protein